MASGEINGVYTKLGARGGVVTGSPSKLLNSLGANMPWRDFRLSLGDHIETVGPNRYRLALPGFEVETVENNDTSVPIGDLDKWAESAANFLLGEQEAMRPHGDDYRMLANTVGSLAVAVDADIATHFYPPDTEGVTMTMYAARETNSGLYYIADANKFKIYGGQIEPESAAA